MWKIAIALVGFIIFGALLGLATGADAVSDLGHILLPAFGAIVIMAIAIGVAPLLDRDF